MTIDCFVSVTRNDILITARHENKLVGKLSFDLYEENGAISAASFMVSEESGLGVPRALLEQATETLQETATRRKTRVIDEIFFLNEDARIKLSHIYEGCGYQKSDEGLDESYRRIYEPK